MDGIGTWKIGCRKICGLLAISSKSVGFDIAAWSESWSHLLMEKNLLFDLPMKTVNTKKSDSSSESRDRFQCGARGSWVVLSKRDESRAS